MCEYNKSIADLHTRKGSITDYDGIGMEEGPWPQKAYWDALGRARERDASWYIDYGWTRPNVISRGAIPQGAQGISPGAGLLEGANVEELPAPEPTPARPPGDAAGASPLPPPQPLPQETRNIPSRGTPRAALSAPANTDLLSEPTGTPVAAQPVRSRPTVMPTGYWAEGAGNDNPLRGPRSRPVGTGVVATRDEG